MPIQFYIVHILKKTSDADSVSDFHAESYLALIQGGCEIFEKGHRHKIMKFLIIVHFHVSIAL